MEVSHDVMVIGPELAAAYRVWKARKDRTQEPEGEFDRAGRWFPSEAEERSCCYSIRTLSRRWPYTLINHCRSGGHVAALTGVDYRALHAWWRIYRVSAETPYAIVDADEGNSIGADWQEFGQSGLYVIIQNDDIGVPPFCRACGHPLVDGGCQ